MEQLIQKASDIVNEIRKVVIGKDDIIIKTLTAVFAGGHVLLEDIPGVGKTTLALALAQSMSLDYNRLQFTPDVLPSDVTGFSIYNPSTGNFEYKEGAVNCNLFLADEINRTSSKTQSALLEVMEEGNVTVDGITRTLPDPFVVIATQNPIGSVGTQKLPESQMDRFMIRLSMGYPSMENEISILRNNGSKRSRENVNAAVACEDVIRIRQFVDSIVVKDEILSYITGIVNKTRTSEYLELGVSPRGSIALLQMSKANAFMHGRNYVIPNDVKEMVGAVCTHRIILSQKAKIDKVSAARVLSRIAEEYPVPKM